MSSSRWLAIDNRCYEVVMTQEKWLEKLTGNKAAHLESSVSGFTGLYNVITPPIILP